MSGICRHLLIRDLAITFIQWLIRAVTYQYLRKSGCTDFFTNTVNSYQFFMNFTRAILIAHKNQNAKILDTYDTRTESKRHNVYEWW
jgi:hypothetical protein